MNELELTGRPGRTSWNSSSRAACCTTRSSRPFSRCAMLPRAGHRPGRGVEFPGLRPPGVLWNRKWRGERPLLDAAGRPLDPATLDDAERMDAILCWSAIPGGSRHHWGTDVDVIDAAAMPDGYQVQLVAAEYAADGVFARSRRGSTRTWSIRFSPALCIGRLRRGHRALAPELLACVLRGARIAHPAGAARAVAAATCLARRRCWSDCPRSTRASSSRSTPGRAGRCASRASRPAPRMDVRRDAQGPHRRIGRRNRALCATCSSPRNRLPRQERPAGRRDRRNSVRRVLARTVGP